MPRDGEEVIQRGQFQGEREVEDCEEKEEDAAVCKGGARARECGEDGVLQTKNKELVSADSAGVAEELEGIWGQLFELTITILPLRPA